MSLPTKVQGALAELRRFQERNLRTKMEAKEVFGQGTVSVRNIIADTVQKYEGTIIFENFILATEEPNGFKSGRLHRDQVCSCQITNAGVIFKLKDFPPSTYTVELNDTEQIERVLAKMRPRPPPRRNLHKRDGNVTSLDIDSKDSGAGKTGGVNNSFDSDQPSENV